MDRRSFFSSGILGAMAIGAASIKGVCGQGNILSAPTPKILNYHPAMKYRRMGNTGVYVSEISLGGLVMAESVEAARATNADRLHCLLPTWNQTSRTARCKGV
jgi:hypothetical protein